MFFVLAKVAGFFIHPSNAMFALAVVGAMLMPTRFARAGRRCIVIAIVLIGAFGLLPLGNLLIYPLEQRFPKWDAARGAPDGLIVLGGAINPENSEIHGEPALNEAAERITVVAALARRYPQARVVYSGGSGNLLPGGLSEAQFAVDLLESFGVARSRIRVEGYSRNTIENARFIKALVAPKPGERWLLITSAHHMPRPIGIFRRIDFPVEAYPVDWRIGPSADLIVPFALVSDGLKRTDTAFHEWVGLIGYRLAGYTPELFPGPR
jgi:uncharacterized SAM-binding protein YcdF (DUF218 family)